ncbi:MAG: 50S ribosomal protein L11 methyltransferase [Pseudomonadota bacterium]
MSDGAPVEHLEDAAGAASAARQRLQQALARTLPMARLESLRLPDCDDIELLVINADFPTGPLEPDVMRAVIAEPAYWAFCWGSGQALARWLLAQPERVRGRRVLDLGSGSGVAGIAAALAGAASVVACDIDADARLASVVNAHLNGVDVEPCERLQDAPPADVIVLADVLYDAANLPLLDAARCQAGEVIVADSRIDTLPSADFELLDTLAALTLPNLGEFDVYGTTRIWRAPGLGPR